MKSSSRRPFLLGLLVVFVCAPANIGFAIADEAQDDSGEVESDDETVSSDLNYLLRGRVVDEEENPVADATIKTMTEVNGSALETKSRRSGAFAIKVPAQGHYGPSFLVTDATGKLASFVSAYDYTTSDRELINVTLKPWRSTTVTVIDDNRAPVRDATVVLQASYHELVRQQTDADGKATLTFPADAKVDWINALKDGAGYDYYENYDAFPTQERLEVPADIQLVLNGAVSVTVTVIDDVKQPVAGASVAPWTIKLPDKLSYANVGAALMQKTDAAGQTTLQWIPQRLEGGTTMLVYHQDYHCPKTPRYQPGEPTELTADVFRKATVSGKVTFADGTPAGGIRLQGEGRGATNHYFRGYATTKPDGTYEIDIYPNQETILAITDQDYAAESATGIDLLPAKNAKADFVLTTGTLIHGTMTVGDDKGPMTGETATLIQESGTSSLVRWSQSDPEGHYRFRVGPGTYQLRLPGKDQIHVVVKNEVELVHDAHIDRRPRGKLIGSLVDMDDHPIAGVEVLGESINSRAHAGFKSKTDADGRFATERWMDDMLVYAVSRQHRLAGFETVSAADKEMNMTLKPAAMIHGSAQDETGKPMAGKQVQLSFSPIAGGGGVHFMIKTDADGKFAFPSATGVACKTYLRIGDSFQEGSNVIVQKTKRYEIKPFKIKGGND